MRKSPADYQVAKRRPIQPARSPSVLYRKSRMIKDQAPNPRQSPISHTASKELYLKRISIWLCALYGVSSAQATSSLPQRWLHMRRPIIFPTAKRVKNRI